MTDIASEYIPFPSPWKDTLSVMANGGNREVETDDPHSGNPDRQELGGCIEEAEQLSGSEEEQNSPCAHNTHCYESRDPNRVEYPLFLPCPVVEGDDTDHGGDKTEDRHEDETLQPEVDTEEGHCRAAEGDHDRIHADHSSGSRSTA